MIKTTIFLVLLMSVFIFPVRVHAQSSYIVDSCVQRDLADVIKQWLKKNPANKPDKQGSLLLVPFISSNPSTGFAFGVTGQYAFNGKDPQSLYSNINGGLTYTLKNQLMFQVKNNIFLDNDQLFLSGDWRILLFSQSTYGLGTNSPQGGVLKYQFALNGWETADDSLVQPMKFDQYRFYQTISWRVSKSIFIGVGYHLDMLKQIVDERLDTLLPLYTSHYLYSKKYNFNPQNYTVSGLSFNVSMDTRDNLLNPYRGIYANFDWRLNPEFLGSDRNANLLSLEWRSYHRLSAGKPRHLLAFWLMGNFSKKGQLPYLILPALGYDQRGRAGRGYTQGRFRGNNLVYSEAEYRFPISTCSGILGGVIFANATTTSNPTTDDKLFNVIAPGYGFGLRIMVDKKSRTNLQVDFGMGKNSGGIYFGASETF